MSKFHYENFAYDARHLANSWKTQAQMTNWYRIVIPDLDEITIMVRQCDLPYYTTSPVTLAYGNSVAKVPGQASWNESSFSFMDLIGLDVEKKLLEWQYMVYDPKTGSQGWIDEFKKGIFVTQYGPDGRAQRSWKMYGCWPSQINPGTMNSESASVKVLQVTIQFDRAERLEMKETPTFSSARNPEQSTAWGAGPAVLVGNSTSNW